MRAYVTLIEAFVTGCIGAEQFEPIYLALFKTDPGGRPEPVFQVLDALFGDVDAYDSNAGTTDFGWIDESELKARAANSLGRLRELTDG